MTCGCTSGCCQNAGLHRKQWLWVFGRTLFVFGVCWLCPLFFYMCERKETHNLLVKNAQTSKNNFLSVSQKIIGNSLILSYSLMKENVLSALLKHVSILKLKQKHTRDYWLHMLHCGSFVASEGKSSEAKHQHRWELRWKHSAVPMAFTTGKHDECVRWTYSQRDMPGRNLSVN